MIQPGGYILGCSQCLTSSWPALIQKRDVTDRGIQLTCFDPTMWRYGSGAPTDPFRCLDSEIISPLDICGFLFCFADSIPELLLICLTSTTPFVVKKFLKHIDKDMITRLFLTQFEKVITYRPEQTFFVTEGGPNWPIPSTYYSSLTWGSRWPPGHSLRKWSFFVTNGGSQLTF